MKINNSVKILLPVLALQSVSAVNPLSVIKGVVTLGQYVYQFNSRISKYYEPLEYSHNQRVGMILLDANLKKNPLLSSVNDPLSNKEVITDNCGHKKEGRIIKMREDGGFFGSSEVGCDKDEKNKEEIEKWTQIQYTCQEGDAKAQEFYSFFRGRVANHKDMTLVGIFGELEDILKSNTKFNDCLLESKFFLGGKKIEEKKGSISFPSAAQPYQETGTRLYATTELVNTISCPDSSSTQIHSVFIDRSVQESVFQAIEKFNNKSSLDFLLNNEGQGEYLMMQEVNPIDWQKKG